MLWINDGDRARHPSLVHQVQRRRLRTPRWVEPVADAFAVHAKLEPVLAPMRPAAEIAVIDPSTTLRHWAPEKRQEAERHDLGFYHALVEARLPFELLSDQVMTAEALDRFSVVGPRQCLLPVGSRNARRSGAMSRVAAASSRPMRPRCGTETGAMRAGVRPGRRARRGAAVRPARHRQEQLCRAQRQHPVNAGYDGAARIIGGTRLIHVAPAAGAEQPFLFVPDFPDLPMEEVYPREAPQGAAVVARETGRAAGRCTSPGTSARSSGRCWRSITAG